MKLTLIIVGLALLVAHPVLAAIVLAVTAAVCGLGGWLAVRALRPRPCPLHGTYPNRTTPTWKQVRQ